VDSPQGRPDDALRASAADPPVGAIALFRASWSEPRGGADGQPSTTRQNFRKALHSLRVPNNNLAEYDLRMITVQQNISGCWNIRAVGAGLGDPLLL